MVTLLDYNRNSISNLKKIKFLSKRFSFTALLSHIMLKYISNVFGNLMTKNKFDHYYMSNKVENTLKNAIMSFFLAVFSYKNVNLNLLSKELGRLTRLNNFEENLQTKLYLNHPYSWSFWRWKLANKIKMQCQPFWIIWQILSFPARNSKQKFFTMSFWDSWIFSKLSLVSRDICVYLSQYKFWEFLQD